MEMSPLNRMRVLLSLLMLGAYVANGCPLSEDILPCSCLPVAYGNLFVCRNFNNSGTLVNAVKSLKDQLVHTILLHNIYIKDNLPDDLFEGINVKEIQIQKSHLRFSQPAFNGLDSHLNVLNVGQESLVESPDGFNLAKLSKLTELLVKNYKLKTVKNMWLNEKVPCVQKIELDKNEITNIESRAFANLVHLKEISMADNRINTLKRSMFPQPADQLYRIDLCYNEISSLPKDFFTEMPNLREIILSGNELKTLPEETWQPVWEQLTQILLYENQLECSDEIQWIKRYKKPYQIDGNCVLPKNMAGRSVKELYKT